MRSTTPLGQYLRARRELVRPEDVGLTRFGRRRVPGLRREELATLAGISSDYYLRLEQGRDRHPSPEVVDALARALQLDEDATAHLHSLSRATASRRCPPNRERAPAWIERLIMSWPTTPALVHDRHLDVLAANALASALVPHFRPGVNLVRELFLDPEVCKVFIDCDAIFHAGVAGLRALAGPDLDDPRLAELVAELSACSDRFRRLWARHDVRGKPSESHTIDHPRVGLLTVYPERLAIASADGQILIVYHADADSTSERALLRLAALIADDNRAVT
jgi:transcriptional regulator with XRE-family HTH domain